MKSAIWVLALAGAVSEATEVHRLDGANTQVSFYVEHFGIPWVTARFKDVSGDFVIDRRGASSRVDVSVGIASLDCNDSRWNQRLRSREWLDADRYPRMIYHSLRIELGEGRAVARGELTLHGVTRQVDLNVSELACPGDGLCRFAAHARIRRSDYGLPHGFWTGGDQVEIAIHGAISDG